MDPRLRVLVLLLVCSLHGCSKPSSSAANNSKGSSTKSGSSAAVKQQPSPRNETPDATSFVSHEPLLKGQLKQLAATRSLERLELHRGSIDKDELCECLAIWKNLKRLRLEECTLDDETVGIISTLRQLEVLNIPRGKFTDKSLRSLAQLPNLFLLRFGSPNVTDPGIAELANAPALRFLHLSNVPVTDDGLVALHSMKRLESFYIDGGNETEVGIRDLLKANPTLHFHRNQVHIADDPNADGH